MPTIAMTCSSCQRAFKRRTRKALRTSCPHCGHVMPGPEGQKMVDARLQELEGQRARRRERQRQAVADPPAKPPVARRRARPPAEDQPVAPPTALGTETRVPRHPDSTPPTPSDRHPNLIL